MRVHGPGSTPVFVSFRHAGPHVRDMQAAPNASAEALAPAPDGGPDGISAGSNGHPPSAAPPPADSGSRSSVEDRHALDELWTAVSAAVRERVLPEQFETWFRRATLTHVDEHVARLAVQNSFARDWLQNYYRELLESAVGAVLGGRRRVEICVDAELTVVRTPRPTETVKRVDVTPTATEPTQRGLLGSSDITLNPKYTFENFVVGPCNRFAHAAAVGASESPGNNYNPLFLHGSVGLGKTHLLQSICYNVLAADPSSRILYLSCETFVNHFINALENGDLQRFRHKYRNVDVLVVDDIHILANKERTQDEFFHTFNTLYNGRKQIVLSSDSPPKEIPTLHERLVSRFEWGLVTEIEAPCYETRMAILKRKSRERGHELPDAVARLLAEHIESNIRELEGAVNKLIGYASLSQQPVTPDLAREILQDVFVVRRGQPAMEDIVRVVTDHFGVKLTDLQSRKRTSAVAYPRQVAMYLARKITRHSLEEIGGYFGGRDHSTVLYAVDKITTLAGKDADCRDCLADLLGRLRPGSA